MLALTVLLALLSGCAQTSDDAEAYREEQETSWGFSFIDEIPAYAKAETHPAASAFDGGSGTVEDPYRIANAEQLAYLSYISNTPETTENYKEKRALLCAHYILTSDIVWNDTENVSTWQTQAPKYAWTPICMTDDAIFTGTFDGDGHTISGLYTVSIWEPTQRHVTSLSTAYGLFGYVSGLFEEAAGTIKNVSVQDSLFQLYNVSYLVGGIAGSISRGSIENCHTNVTILCDGADEIAGIVGQANETDIRNCSFQGVITGRQKLYELAGIVAKMTGGSLTDCTSSGLLTPTDTTLQLGGIVASLSDVSDTILNNKDDMTFTIDTTRVRGLTTVDGCVNHSTLSFGGGIIGNLLSSGNDVVVRNCANHANIGGETADSILGGIVGRIAEYGDDPERNPGFLGNVVIENCSNTGAINGGNISGVQLGGIVGIAACQDNAELYINTCQNSGNVSCDNGQLGGILGAALMYGNSTIILSDCENSASVTSAAGNTGGLVGDVCLLWGDDTGRHFSIVRGKNTGNITGSGYGTAGILGAALGHHGGKEESITVMACENSGAVQGLLPCMIGGIAGYLPGNENTIVVSDCTSNGTLLLCADASWNSDDSIKSGQLYGLAGGIVGAAKTDTELSGCQFGGKFEVAAQIEEQCATAPELVVRFNGELILPYTGSTP